VVHLRSIGDEIEDDPFGLGGVRGPQHGDSVLFEGGRGPFDTPFVRHCPEPTAD